jgi:hypothetical protein
MMINGTLVKSSEQDILGKYSYLSSSLENHLVEPIFLLEGPNRATIRNFEDAERQKKDYLA